MFIETELVIGKSKILTFGKYLIKRIHQNIYIYLYFNNYRNIVLELQSIHKKFTFFYCFAFALKLVVLKF